MLPLTVCFSYGRYRSAPFHLDGFPASSKTAHLWHLIGDFDNLYMYIGSQQNIMLDDMVSSYTEILADLLPVFRIECRCQALNDWEWIIPKYRLQKRRDLFIKWAEVQTPLRDAMSLVDDHQADLLADATQHELQEPVRRQPFRR